MTVKGRRAEYREATRGAVLDAAAELFAEQGFTAATIDDVARAARVGKGTVYYHFTDKAHLFEAVFRDRQQRLVADVAAAAVRHDRPWPRLTAALDAYLEGTVTDAAHRSLLQQAPAALGAERCRELDEQMGLPALQALLDDLAAAGELSVAPSPMLTRLLFSALCEAAMTAGAAPDPAQARHTAFEALQAILAGLRRQASGDRAPAPATEPS
ncbi:TetR/AcrR family transcriptional regulator [Actinomadura verrucosospora]|uniref:TetR-type transcriptional regulator n=1 Tax=Actinomadura verrucosospora TaxID=46165 RepID=A0A7D3ZI68_ACTVE|nr:TetR family transcriptional regulator [Actinomadura verrucosospora]QKG24557.1 TetR-type transcriptional regulator [Actinomadura verrucosospora]